MTFNEQMYLSPLRYLAYSAAFVVPISFTKIDSYRLRRALRLVFVFYLLSHIEMAWQEYQENNEKVIKGLLKVTMFHLFATLAIPTMIFASYLPMIPDCRDENGGGLGQFAPTVACATMLVVIQQTLDDVILQMFDHLI